MTRRLPLFVTLALGLLFGACGGPRLAVEYDYDDDASFDSLKTWSFLPRNGSETGNTEVDQVIREELSAELARRGFEEVSTAGDFRVGFLLETDRKVTQRYVSTQLGYAHEYYPFDVAGSVEVVVEDYLEGTLIVDVARADGKQPIWRGWAEGVIREKLDAKHLRSGVRDAVRRILVKFPPPAKRKRAG